MCINSITPAWVRVRHWSAPEGTKEPKVPDLLARSWETPLTMEEQFERLSLNNVNFDESSPESEDREKRDVSPANQTDENRLKKKAVCNANPNPCYERRQRWLEHRRRLNLTLLDNLKSNEEMNEKKLMSASERESKSVSLEKYYETKSYPDEENVDDVFFDAEEEVICYTNVPLTFEEFDAKPDLRLESDQSNVRLGIDCCSQSDTDDEDEMSELWSTSVPGSMSLLESSYITPFNPSLLSCLTSFYQWCQWLFRPPRWKKYRWKEKKKKKNWMESVTFIGTLFLLLGPLVASPTAETKDKICSTMVIKEHEALEKLTNCTHIEGNLIMAIDIVNYFATEIPSNITFPNLQEITEYLIVYQSMTLNKLSNLFPNLAVIRGNKLFRNKWGLVIYDNPNLKEIGLTGLTKILRGGVKIKNNQKLCYVNTINWKEIVHSNYTNFINIENNRESNACPEFCPNHCMPFYQNSMKKTCWNAQSCQKRQVDCLNPMFRDSICFRENGLNEDLVECSNTCVGGCSKSSRFDCTACKFVTDFSVKQENESRCKQRCPPGLLLYQNWRCIEKGECYQKEVRTLPRTVEYKVYKGSCLEECPAKTEEMEDSDGNLTCKDCEDCPKKCSGGHISSTVQLEKYKDCTHIEGDLSIQMTGTVVNELSKNLARVREISGYLKISRTKAIVSLDFFKDLRLIKGEGPSEQLKYSLYIMENDNLQTLFPDNNDLKIYRTLDNGTRRPGLALIHNNALLCKSEIKKLIKQTGIRDPGDSNTDSSDISFVTNGNKAICSSRKLNVKILSIEASMTMISFQNYQEVIEQDYPKASIRTLLGYEVNYREISVASFNARNVTKYYGRDACGFDGWTVQDVMPSKPDFNEATGENEWLTEKAFLTVKPFSKYALYVSTMLLKDYAMSNPVEGAESDIIYFETPSDIPEPPVQLKTAYPNYTSLELSWDPPVKPNGIIDHYELVLELEELKEDELEDLLSRPYCTEGFKIKSMRDEEKKKKDKEIPKQEQTNTSLMIPPSSETAPPGFCRCDTCAPEELDPRKIREEELFEDEIINRVLYVDIEEGENGEEDASDIYRRRKRSLSEGKRENALASEEDQEKSIDENDFELDEDKSETFVQKDSFPRHTAIVSFGFQKPRYSYVLPQKRIREDQFGNRYYLTYSIRIPGNQTRLSIPKLKHYGSYSLKLRACQRPFDASNRRGLLPDGANDTFVKYCSKDLFEQVRVLHKPGADNIKGGITTSSQNDTEFIWIRWKPPKDPNGVIVNYKIDMKPKIDAPPELHSHTCVTAKKFREDGHKFRFSLKGGYYVSVTAVSLYGPGDPTEFEYVSITGYTSTILYIILPILIVILLIMVFLVFWYLKKPKEDEMRIVTDNGGYISVKELYKDDGWEINRNLITLGEELGRGAFGRVYKGVYNHPDEGLIECAVKTVQEGASHRENMQFLVEAHTMKSFRTPHVVSLIGVVFKNQPHWVILELMGNGDLKTYLRGLRPDAPENTLGKPPPTEREVKQMALEIADGMAYLSTHHKHIIHRDLAARNCMVTSDVVVKIGDFGMAREIYTTDYYRKGDKGYMPIRWMAPESLKDGVATTAADVWSFGIVLWEMVTLAELPYKGYSNHEVIDKVIKGGIMDRPESCPNDLWDLMRECWHRNPLHRPSFLDLCERLLPIANERFQDDCFILSGEGQAALQRQTEERRYNQEMAEKNEERTRLTGNGNSNSNGGGSINYGNPDDTTENGHVVQMMEMADRPTGLAPTFRLISDPSSTSTRNPAAMISKGFKKLRHKSGSASGEA